MPFTMIDTDNILKAISNMTPVDTLTIPVERVTIKSKTKPSLKLPPIRHIQFNPKTGHTAIVWDDGSEATVVRCGNDEKFEPYAGFCAAIVKKLFGNTTAAKRVMDELDVDKAKARKAAEQAKEAARRREEEARNHKRKVKSMAKRLGLAAEAAEMFMKDKGVDKIVKDLIMEEGLDVASLLNTGDKDGDPVDGNAV